MLPGRAGSSRMRGCMEPCNHMCMPVILLVTPEAELVVVAAVPAGNGMISGPKVRPPSVERRMRTSPLVPPVLVDQATQTSPLGATATSDGQVNPSLGPDRLPGRVVQVTPWLVERAKRTGALSWLKSCQTTYRLLANGLDGLASAAIHSLSRFGPLATKVGLPITVPVVGLICSATTFGPAGVPPVR